MSTSTYLVRFIGEESVADGVKCVLTDDPTWVIDPVDGTMNFVHGLPLVAISIGLLIKKQAVLGIIYNPLLNQMFTAKVGHGAHLNGKPIRVSGETGTVLNTHSLESFLSVSLI